MLIIYKGSADEHTVVAEPKGPKANAIACPWEEGHKEGHKELFLQMMSNGIAVETIAKMTGLSVEMVEKIVKELW